MRKDLTSVEAIGLAVRSEEEARVFYEEISSKVKNPLVKARFDVLAKEELGHKRLLLVLYKRMTGETSEPPTIPGDPQVAEKASLPIDIEKMEELLEFAMQRERDSQKFYKNAAEKTKDVSGKRTFEYLADIERAHEAMLKSELDAYLRDKNWYSDNSDIQLVGP